MKTKIINRKLGNSLDVSLPYRLFKKYIDKNDYVLNRETVVVVN